MLKTNSFAVLLVAVLLGSVLITMGLCYSYVRSLSGVQVQQAQSQRLRTQMMLIERNRALIQSLASEALEYSKQHPAIDPLLFQFNIKPKPTTASPAKPTTR